MNRTLITLSTALLLTACGSTAIMDKSNAVKAQPEMIIKTDGDFWGLGQQGTFDLNGLYNGQYARSASGSTWFNRLSFKDGEMGAEISKTNSDDTWRLTCSGGGVSVNYMGVDFGGNDPYECQISQNNREIGTYILQADSSFVDIGIEKKEEGFIRVGETRFAVETIHTGEGLLMPLEKPLGYSIKHNGEEIAAVQTNGMLTLQWLSELSEGERDVVMVAAIASALSWRPED